MLATKWGLSACVAPVRAMPCWQQGPGLTLRSRPRLVGQCWLMDILTQGAVTPGCVTHFRAAWVDLPQW